MKKKISFDIECGEKTCASKPGNFCRFFRGSLNGNDTCYLFGRVYSYPTGYGCIQRHKDCIKNTGCDIEPVQHDSILDDTTWFDDPDMGDR